ncbi:hypothetical protein ACJX0J_020505, partial [Zea mays]
DLRAFIAEGLQVANFFMKSKFQIKSKVTTSAKPMEKTCLNSTKHKLRRYLRTRACVKPKVHFVLLFLIYILCHYLLYLCFIIMIEWIRQSGSTIEKRAKEEKGVLYRKG